jgi:hypothetical protein
LKSQVAQAANADYGNMGGGGNSFVNKGGKNSYSGAKQWTGICGIHALRQGNCPVLFSRYVAGKAPRTANDCGFKR